MAADFEMFVVQLIRMVDGWGEIRRQHVVMTEDINLIMVFKVIHGWRSISHVPRREGGEGKKGVSPEMSLRNVIQVWRW